MNKKIFSVLLAISLVVPNIGIISYAKEDTAYKNEVDVICDTEDDSYYKLKTLLVTSNKELTNTYDAIAAENCCGVIQILQYENENDTKYAYNQFKKDGYQVSVDQPINIETNNYETGSYLNENHVVDQLGLDAAQAITKDKDEFRVAILDRPYNAKDFPDNRVVTDTASYSAIDRDENGNILYDNYGDPIYKDFDIDFNISENKHGTYVTDVILDSTSSNVKAYSYCAGINHTYIDENGNTKSETINSTSATISQEIDKIIEDGCKIVNMSIQWKITNSVLALQMKAILNKLHSNGIIVVAAAGNDSTTINDTMFPQCLDYPIIVSSVNNSKSLSSFSNTGNEVDICAPGEYVNTVYNTSVFGTSFSSPYIASFVTELLQLHQYDNLNEVESSLYLYCKDLGDTGKDNLYGNGFPTFLTDSDMCEKDIHDYDINIINPTCTEKGFTVKTCKNCGKVIITDITDTIPHEYIEVTEAATCQHPMYIWNVCDKCGHKELIKSIGNKTAHSYILDDNGVYVCKYCGYKKPIAAEKPQTTQSTTTTEHTTQTTEKQPTTEKTTESIVNAYNNTITITKNPITIKHKTKINFKWKKIKKAKYYKIQISTSKKFSKKTTKTYTTKKTKYTIKKLTKKKYYVRVRPKVSKKYGKWSKTYKYYMY